MRNFKRILSVIIIMSMVCGFIPETARLVFADPASVNVYVDSYDGGKLNISWDEVSGTQSAEITYHSPSDGQEKYGTVDDGNTSGYIEGLQNNYIYDISVKLFDGAGNQIGEGLLYYLPQISFSSERLEQEREPVDGGGYETGVKPRLKLEWTMPMVYDADSGEFVNASTSSALKQMQDRLNEVYDDGLQVSKMDFRINISTDSTKLNGDSNQSAVLVEYQDTGYKAYVSGDESVSVNVYTDDGGRNLSFDLMGRKDESESTPEAEEYALPDPDILPGTVYYMNIKPVFKDSEGDFVNVLTAGKPGSLNASPLFQDGVDYTYTPIRFQVGKDTENNLYVRIFKINQGSLDLPKLYYEVQASDDSSIPGDWEVKKTMDDTYFNSDYAVTVIPGISPNNKTFYKVVAKSDGPDDRLESCALEYTLAYDTSRPPLPTGVTVIDTTPVIETAEGDILKSTDVTISWEKPSNWDEIKSNTDADEDIVFHFVLNVSQEDLEEGDPVALETEGKTYGEFPAVYRLVNYVSALSDDIKENDSRLEYTIKGFELFKGQYYTGGTTSEGDPEIVVEDIDKPEPDSDGNEYPDYLLPNMVYYLKMYTTKGEDRGETDEDKTSGMSVVVSFTTFASVEPDVPVPYNFRVNSNEIVEGKNQVELQFERVDVDWSDYGAETGQIYYDLYMSTRTEAESFIKIGTTQEEEDFGDVLWEDDLENTFVKATVKSFAPDTGEKRSYTAFGDGLKPNTTYYFIVKTRLVTDENSDDRESESTSILSVTTLKGDIIPPDPDSRKPLSPEDFAIAEDEDGNLLLSGFSVTFDWSKREEDVKYQLICTSERIESDAEPSEYENDSLYKSFISTFGSMDNDGDDDVFTLDPSTDLLEGYFELDNSQNPEKFKLTIDEWIFPNRLYYFSLRAILNENESYWICIPVTTYLIEAPSMLEVVSDCELGFFWNDDVSMEAEDYKVYMKGPEDDDYNLLTSSMYTVIKDGTTYYARVKNLEADSSYNVRVFKGDSSSELVYEENGLQTRNTFHEIEVKWKGKKGYEYEIAIKALEDEDYQVLSDSNLEKYTDKDGDILPYYVEEVAQTAGTDYSYYYARIKTVPISLSGGNEVSRELESNTKYYIKVRAVKVDSDDPAVVSRSKYDGPVETRTEFNQDDYDDTDQDNKKKVVFLDKIEELEEGYYWRVDIDNNKSTKILLKADRVSNAVENQGDYPFVIDISALSPSIDRDEIFVPLDIIKTLNSENKSMVIKVPGSEYTFRPNTIDEDNTEEVEMLFESSKVEDIFLKIIITREDDYDEYEDLPSGAEPVCDITGFSIETLGVSQTYDDMKELIEEKLYDENSGLVSEKLNILEDSNFDSSSEYSDLLEEYTQELIEEMENELSNYIDDLIDDKEVENTDRDIDSFEVPIAVTLFCDEDEGLKVPYVLYDYSSEWKKLTDSYAGSYNSITFNVISAGEYVIASVQAAVDDVPYDHPYRDVIIEFTSKYDLSGVFSDINVSFHPEMGVTGKEMVLLYQIVMGKKNINTGSTIREKVEELGLDDIINLRDIMKNINKQTAAAVALKIYCEKTGVQYESLRPSATIFINDEEDIGNKYYKSVVLAVDINILELDEQGNFKPADQLTRAEVIAVLARTLQYTGEM